MQDAGPFADVRDVAVHADQLRAARAMLGWSLVEAGRRASVSVARVVASERSGFIPSGGAPDRGLVEAYGAVGVRFFDHGEGGRGLSLARRPSATP